jgi:hypothetical protein
VRGGEAGGEHQRQGLEEEATRGGLTGGEAKAGEQCGGAGVGRRRRWRAAAWRW